VLYGFCGIALALVPIAGVVAPTALLGTLLLIHAGVATATAFQMRSVEGSGWFLFDAVASLLLGILMFAKWPSASVWAIQDHDRNQDQERRHQHGNAHSRKPLNVKYRNSKPAGEQP
jgi:hypothetical protein